MALFAALSQNAVEPGHDDIGVCVQGNSVIECSEAPVGEVRVLLHVHLVPSSALRHRGGLRWLCMLSIFWEQEGCVG